MQAAQDSLDAGTVIAAWLSPAILGELEPVLRRMLSGQQLFVKQRDGSYRPKGLELGLPRSFDFTDLHEPTVQHC